ncbi:hypothetical protein CBL_05328 [Carabus blaptoides fortunei]
MMSNFLHGSNELKFNRDDKRTKVKQFDIGTTGHLYNHGKEQLATLLMVTYGSIICPSRANRRPVERLSLMEVSGSRCSTLDTPSHTHVHYSNTRLLVPSRHVVTYEPAQFSFPGGHGGDVILDAQDMPTSCEAPPLIFDKFTRRKLNHRQAALELSSGCATAGMCRH